MARKLSKEEIYNELVDMAICWLGAEDFITDTNFTDHRIGANGISFIYKDKLKVNITFKINGSYIVDIYDKDSNVSNLFDVRDNVPGYMLKDTIDRIILQNWKREWD